MKEKIYITILLIVLVVMLSDFANNPTATKTNNPTNTLTNNPRINNDPTIKPKIKSKFDGTFTNETRSAYIIVKGNKTAIVNDLKEEKFWETCEVKETETSKEMKYIYPDGSGEYTYIIIDNRLKEISKDYNFGDVTETFFIKIK